jgi:NAD(P)H dehydrogenase (quinone)
MSIIVTGATGHLGGLVIRKLLEKIPVNRIVACVRDREKAGRLLPPGLEIRQADYNHFDSLRQALAGADKLLFVSSPDLDNTRRAIQHATVALAAREAGVKHILYTGFAFAEESKMPFASLHLASEYAIRTTGLPYTFLRNALYTDDAFISPALKAAVAAGELVSNCRQGKINAVSRADLARAAAAALSGEGHQNKTYNLVAPRPWDFTELARVLSEISGKKIAFRPVPAEEGKGQLVVAGVPEPVAGFLSFIYEQVAAGETARTSPDLEALIGKAITLREDVAAVLRA